MLASQSMSSLTFWSTDISVSESFPIMYQYPFCFSHEFQEVLHREGLPTLKPETLLHKVDLLLCG